MKRTLQYSILILLTAISFLFSPKPKNDKGPGSLCPVNYIQLNKYMGFSMNCDAIEYMGGSVNPGFLFKKNYSRQSRPLYLLTGSIAGYTIYYLSFPFHNTISKIASPFFQNQLPQNEVSLYLSHYAGLILINLLVLVFSLFLFEKIINHITGGWKNGVWLKYALFLLLISNHITKTFFWTPHQQMFNTILPLVCIWVYIEVISSNKTVLKQLISSFLIGTLLLFYGSFLLLLPSLIIALLYKNKFILKQNLLNGLQSALFNSIAFILPLLCWILILKISGINFYSHETEYFREFAWVFDAIVDPNRRFINELVTNFSTYIKTTGMVIFPTAFLMLTYLISRNKFKQTELFLIKNIFALTTFLIFLFFLFLGYYTDRLTYSLCPLLITYATILLNRQQLSKLKVTGIILLILAWHLFILLYEMPHFTDRFYY